jgi:hypothetical protein
VFAFIASVTVTASLAALHHRSGVTLHPVDSSTVVAYHDLFPDYPRRTWSSWDKTNCFSSLDLNKSSPYEAPAPHEFLTAVVASSPYACHQTAHELLYGKYFEVQDSSRACPGFVQRVLINDRVKAQAG